MVIDVSCQSHHDLFILKVNMAPGTSHKEGAVALDHTILLLTVRVLNIDSGQYL